MYILCDKFIIKYFRFSRKIYKPYVNSFVLCLPNKYLILQLLSKPVTLKTDIKSILKICVLVLLVTSYKLLPPKSIVTPLMKINSRYVIFNLIWYVTVL